MMLYSPIVNMYCTLEMDGADSLKELVTISQITWRHIPEKCSINIHCHKKSQILYRLKFSFKITILCRLKITSTKKLLLSFTCRQAIFWTELKEMCSAFLFLRKLRAFYVYYIGGDSYYRCHTACLHGLLQPH